MNAKNSILQMIAGLVAILLAVALSSRGYLVLGTSLGLAILVAAAIYSLQASNIRSRRLLDSLRQNLLSLGDEADLEPSQTEEHSRDLITIQRELSRAHRTIRQRIRRLQGARQDLENMLETIPEAVLAIDTEHRVLFANSSTNRLFGLSGQEMTGQRLWSILRQPALQDAVAMTFASKTPVELEFDLRRPNRVVAFGGRSLSVGTGRGVIFVLRDVTELRRLERLRQEFFASISHELKTPLAAIKAYTETLLDDENPDSHTLRRFLGRIEEQTDRLHSLVIDMLMLARVESEDPGFDIQVIDILPIVQNSYELFRNEAEAKGLQMNLSLAGEQLEVTADSEGIGMIARNLIDNAVKYTPRGGKIDIATRIEDRWTILTVSDTGIGIPEHDLVRIFERFYRVDKARSRELGGTGLGLSIVKHLTQRFGGDVSVTSRLNEGTTFVVRLPSHCRSTVASVRTNQTVTKG